MDNEFVFDHLTERRGLRIEHGRRGGNFHGLGDGAGLEGNRDDRRLVDLQRESAQDFGLETGESDSDSVFAARKARRIEIPLFIGRPLTTTTAAALSDASRTSR